MIINFSNLGGGGGGGYTLPTATASRLGGVKIGSGVTVTDDGTISVSGGSVYTAEISGFEPNDWTQSDQDTLQDVIDYVDEQGGVPDVKLVAGGLPFYLVRNDSSVLVFIYSNPVLNEYVPVKDAYISDLVIELHTDDITESVSYEYSTDYDNTRRFVAGSLDDASGVTSMDGDILVTEEHVDDPPAEFTEEAEQGNYAGAIMNLAGGMYGSAPALKLSVEPSPYFLGGDDYGDAVWVWQIDGLNYGFGFNYDGFMYWNGTTSTNIEDCTATGLTPGDSFEVLLEGGINFGGGGDQNSMFVYSGNTDHRYGLTIEIFYPETSYFKRGDDWIKVASSSEVKSVSDIANSAYGMAINKVGQDWMGVSDWADLEYLSTNIGEINVDGIDRGIRIHVPGAKTEAEHPRVDQIVTGSNGVLKIVKITQSDYNNLGTYDPSTLYFIIPSNA